MDPLVVAVFFFLFLPGLLLLVAVIAGFIEKREKRKIDRSWFEAKVVGKKKEQ